MVRRPQRPQASGYPRRLPQAATPGGYPRGLRAAQPPFAYCTADTMRSLGSGNGAPVDDPNNSKTAG
jgi:hypothetical protein